MSKRSSKVITYILLILFSILFLIPFYILIVTSLKPVEGISHLRMWELPSKIDFSSFIKAFRELSPNVWNSFIMAIPSTLISAFIGSINGYVFSKWKFKGSEIIFSFLLFGMFIPYQSILIPLITTINSIGLYNTIPGLVLTHVVYGIPITTLMFRNFYVSIPQSMVEAAQIDGAGFFRTYLRIILPLSVSGFIVVIIWQFTNIWNEFLFAITITGHRQYPVMVAVQNLAGSQIVEWNIQMAGAMLAAIPTILIYILLGRYFIQGLFAGSVK